MRNRLIYFSLIFSIVACIAAFTVSLPTSIRYSLLSSFVALDSPFINYQLGDCYFKGIGVERDLTQAENYYQKAAQRNYAKAMYKLGNLYSHRHGMQKGMETEAEFWNNIPLDLQQAVRWYTLAAKLGCASACLRLGYLYRTGTGAPIDYFKSFFWYRKAAKAGSAKAQEWLGYFYSHGLDREPEWENTPACWVNIKKNYKKALVWYLKAAVQGHKTAQYMVGFMYSHGAMNTYGYTRDFDQICLELPDIPLDYAKAVYWFTKAAEQGHIMACRKLGFLYLHGGQGIQQDASAAFHWYQKGADRGDAASMRKIAYCYEDSIGTSLNTHLAHIWYTKAAQNGDTLSQYILNNKKAR